MLRPSTTSSGVGWTATPSGTLHGVTSDDSDSTYALWGGTGSAMILGTPPDAPPAGERRHQVRLRARGEDGDAWWAVRLATGGLVAGASASFPSSPSTVVGSWGFGAPADGSIVLSCYVAGQSPSAKITELYLDVDSREAPTFTPQVLDGSGTVTTTITDTNQPTLRVNALDLDGLAARQYRFWVTLSGAVIWDTGVVSGSPVNRLTAPLANGSYVAHYLVWSTLGDGVPYASDEETLSFTMAVGDVPEPDPPAVTPAEPFYSVEVCAPDMDDFDGGQGYLEIQRVDCPRDGYLATIRDTDGYASTPSGTTPTSNLQITVKAGRDDGWFIPAGTFQTLVANWNQTAGQHGWHLVLPDDGRLALTWSTDGTAVEGVQSTVRVPVDPLGIVRVRVLLTTDDGAGGWTVTYFSRETDDDPWVQLGDVITHTTGTTSVFDTPADITVGAYLNGALVVEAFTGRFYNVEIRNGPTGTIIADPDFTIWPESTVTFPDTAGKTWTVHVPAMLTSEQAGVSIAMLGPLETGECATWTDYTMPRTGIGSTCDHQPGECCSFYRVRSVGRVDGSILVSDWAQDSGPTDFCLVWDDRENLIRTTGPDGPLWAPVGGEFEWDVTRPFTAASGVNGTRFVTSAPPGGRNLHMVAAVESEAELAELHAVLSRPLVLISPSDSNEVWAAPVAESVRVVKIGRIRQVTADFIGTGPQPGPQLADVE